MVCSNRNWTMLEHKNLVPIIALVLGAKWLLQNLDCSFKSAQCVVNILAFKHEERTFGLTCCINWGLATPPPPLLFEHIDIVIIQFWKKQICYGIFFTQAVLALTHLSLLVPYHHKFCQRVECWMWIANVSCRETFLVPPSNINF